MEPTKKSSRKREPEFTTASTIDRVPPNDINAEAAVLSAMMLDTMAVATGIETLKDSHFYKNAHRVIFKCMSELFEQNIEVDLITLIHKLEEAGDIEMVGGKAYINELSDIVLSSANIEYHAKIVLDKALLRGLITTANEIIKMAYDAEHPSSEIIDIAEQKIFEIAEMPHRRSFTRVGDVIGDAKARIDEMMVTQTSILGIPSGFTALDIMLGGFRKGQFIVIAARPAMGKSSFALNIAAYLTSSIRKKKVAIFTLEMATDELIFRLISSESEIPMQNLMKGQGITSKQVNSIAGVVEAYSDADLYIDDTGSNTVMDIKAKTRRLKAELKGLDLIIIDYIQLMSSRRQSENRQQEISEISRGLKTLAKELDLPVIALSQLNRSLESRPDKRPKLSDLRESGAIEQDADIVMFIYREAVYTNDEKKLNDAEIIIGKNRHGAIGHVPLKFISSITKFGDADAASENN